MKTMIKNSLKLLLAASLLLAIGWSIILFNGTPAAPVKEVRADIAMLNFGPKTQQQLFVEGIKELGMEDPRSYDWNGNKVFFSMLRTKDEPRTVLKKAHAIFQRNGLNKKSSAIIPPNMSNVLNHYLEHKKMPRDPKQINEEVQANLAYYDDFFTGGLVPVVDAYDHIVMAGGVGHGKNINNTLDYVRSMSGSNKNMIEQIKSMQVLDATRNPGADHTLVTAVWSDSDLDFKRFINQGEGLAADPDVPSCPGCQRLMSLGGETGNEVGYKSTSFVSEASSKENFIQFYDRTLGARGWRRMDSSVVMERMHNTPDLPFVPPAGVVAYSRGDKFITVDVSNSQGSSFVQLMQSP